MSKIKFSLLSIIEAIDKIELYTKEFDDSESFYYEQKSLPFSSFYFLSPITIFPNLRTYHLEDIIG